MPVPPQGSDDTRGELARARERHVGVERGIVAADDRVLPRRDPQGVEVGLRGPQAVDPVLGRGLGHMPLDQVDGAFVEGSGRLPVIVAHDPSVGRVRRIPGHPRDLERTRVHPHAVAVATPQSHRSVGDDSIQRFLRRVPGREHVHRPAAPHDPRVVGMRRRVITHDAFVLGKGVCVGKVAAQHLQATGGRMDVGVLEPRQEHPVSEIHDVRPRTDQLPDLGVGADRDDPPLPDRDPTRPSPGGVHRVDAAVHERETRGSVRLHSRSLSRSVLSDAGARRA